MRPLLLLLLILPALSSAEKRPTRGALRKAFEQNVGTLVQVSNGRRTGAGVVVGAGGQVITTVEHVGLDEAKVRLAGGEEVAAKVVLANALLKIAVLEVPTGGADLKATAVRTDAPLGAGTWLLGIRAGKSARHEPKPVTGQVVTGAGGRSPFIVTDLPLPPGSPLFDGRGRLVAIVVSRVGRIGSRALPMAAVKAQLVHRVVP